MSAVPGPGTTPGQAACVDPAAIGHRVHTRAFNVLTRELPLEDGLPVSKRNAIATAMAEAIEPLIRADERKVIAARQPQPAPGCPDPSQHRDVYGRPLPDTMPQPVPGETELRRRIEDVARGLDHPVWPAARWVLVKGYHDSGTINGVYGPYTEAYVDWLLGGLLEFTTDNWTKIKLSSGPEET